MSKTSIEPDTTGSSDSPKRRQILDGAREVFRANGFDGASMDHIAKTAAVSKGTLYVYFANKEELFKALILEERTHQADTSILANVAQDPVEKILTCVGHRYLERFLQTDKLSTLRMVLGATEKFPEFGQLVFEAGAQAGRLLLGEVLKKKCDEGELVCEDPFLAASQFIDLSGAWLVRKAMFIPNITFTQAEVDRNVQSAVKVFMAAYGPKD